jgi:glycosyltransferase involved in cell wall biosynthesis
MISLVVPTYKRAWALSFSLESLVKQSTPPDEVVVVLKPSNDGSESIIHKFAKELPIKLVIQTKGFVVDAVQLGMNNSSGDIILFIDDDAIAEPNFVEKYKNFFERVRDAGGATGVVFRAYLEKGCLIKTTEHFIPFNVARRVQHRRPLKVFEKYSGWISKSGLSTTTVIESGNVVLSALLYGANMGFIKEVIEGCPLNQLYRGSRKGFNYESLLAYFAKIKGFNTYKIVNPSIAPTVWHLTHKSHLTLKDDFWSEFWISYDIFKNYFRYKKMGADVSFLSWIEMCISNLRKQTPAKVLALLYTLFDIHR